MSTGETGNSTNKHAARNSMPHETHPDVLAKQRSDLGFDDIPIAEPNAKKPEKQSKKWSKLLSDKHYKNWKDDLQWALRADRDEDTTPPAPPKNHQIPSSPPSQDLPSKTIDININFGELPNISKPNIRSLSARVIYAIKAPFRLLDKLSDKQRSLVGGGLFVAIIILIGTVYVPDIFRSMAIKPTAPNTSGANSTPTYATLLPEKSAGERTWRRVSPPGSDPVYAYYDTIDGITISVSQQPIPDNFQPNIDEKVAELATNYNATDRVSGGSTPIYIGTSSKGPQSVILTKDNLLILIQSTDKITDDSWLKYTESLH